jgi:hypothetical protein
MTIHLICMMQAMPALSLNGQAWFRPEGRSSRIAVRQRAG